MPSTPSAGTRPKMPASHAAVLEYAHTFSACTVFLVPPKAVASASTIMASTYTVASPSRYRVTASVSARTKDPWCSNPPMKAAKGPIAESGTM